ncbi:MAG: lysophospholipid acyltransferase family protein [Sulfuricurvum sp.]|nr:lysophospholipid acyltransferase family protein [Sulfuricurvum sp.]
MIKQRGSGAGLYIVYLFFHFFGYPGLRFILFFVVLYFSITTPTAKRSLREYYLLCTGEFDFRIYYRHLYSYALVFADRFLSKRFLQRYHVNAQNQGPFPSDAEKGILFLFSHVGDWSICERLLSEKKIPVNIVMQEVIKESIQGFGKFIQGKQNNPLRVIDLSEGSIAVAIRIAKAFQNSEIVAMMADRFLTQQGGVPVTFLGKRVIINKNPFEVAYNRKVPLIALLSLREKDYHYNVSYYWLTPYDRTLSKEEAIATAAQEYADILEKAVKEHPDQWFNHYDFFNTGTAV